METPGPLSQPRVPKAVLWLAREGLLFSFVVQMGKTAALLGNSSVALTTFSGSDKLRIHCADVNAKSRVRNGKGEITHLSSFLRREIVDSWFCSYNCLSKQKQFLERQK